MFRRRELRYRAEYVVFRTLCCLVGMLNARQIVRMAEFMAWVMVRLLPKKLTRYQVAFGNLTQAFGKPETTSTQPQLSVHLPEASPNEEWSSVLGPRSPVQAPKLSPPQIDEMIRRMWVHLFRLVAEMVQAPRKLTLTNCREVVSFRNRKCVVKALCSGRPVFVLSGHLGNWEVTQATFGFFGMPMGIVGRELDNPYLHRWFEASREATGHKLLLKKGGWDEMVELLKAGGNLGLLCDQDAGKRGVFVNFFGKPAATFKSIALMALEYKAILVVGYGIRLPDDFENCRWVRYEIGCEEVIDTQELNSQDDVLEITQRYTAALERAICRAPEQYFWVHRRWKTPPPVKRQAARKAG